MGVHVASSQPRNQSASDSIVVLLSFASDVCLQLHCDLPEATAQLLEKDSEIQRLGAASDASAAASSDVHAQHALELQRLRDTHGSEREEHITNLDELASELAKAV